MRVARWPLSFKTINYEKVKRWWPGCDLLPLKLARINHFCRRRWWPVLFILPLKLASFFVLFFSSRWWPGCDLLPLKQGRGRKEGDRTTSPQTHTHGHRDIDNESANCLIDFFLSVAIRWGKVRWGLPNGWILQRVGVITYRISKCHKQCKQRLC